jgi:hypothetical protein
MSSLASSRELDRLELFLGAIGGVHLGVDGSEIVDSALLSARRTVPRQITTRIGKRRIME